MGSWGHNELLLFEDILTGVRVNLKRKRVVSENEDKVVVE